MKPIPCIIALCFATVSYAQTDVSAIEAQLAEARRELTVVVRNTPTALPLVNMPNETNTQRAQRHANAINLAQESWVSEWEARNPMKSAFRAPKMSGDYERQAIQKSDAEALASYKTRTGTGTPNVEAANLRKRIASLEKQLKAQRKNVKAPVEETRKATKKQERVLANWSAVKVGMKREEVRATLGKPNGETSIRWVYVGGGVVNFDANGVVASLSE